MKKFKLTKLIASTLVAISVVALNPIGVSAEWRQDSTGWWYSQGDSYAKGWFKDKDGKLYYFYSDYGYDQPKGYMAHDTIISGYYLNHDGIRSNGGPEIQTYINLLDDTDWQRSNGIMFYDYQSTLDNDEVGKSTINNNIVIDIDQDGVCEMLLHHGTNEANSTISVVTYNNGDIKIEHLNRGIGGYRGYSSSQKVFFIGYTHMDNNITIGYKLENGSCKQVYSSSSYEPINKNEVDFTYTVNEQNVSKEEYEKSFEQFGNVVTGEYGEKTILY